jgi:hypothetical protein
MAAEIVLKDMNFDAVILGYYASSFYEIAPACYKPVRISDEPELAYGNHIILE